MSSMTLFRRFGLAVHGGLKHPLWISLGTLIAVAGLVMAFIQMRHTDRPASVEVSAVTFGSPRAIDATTYPSWDETDRAPADKTVSPVDVTLMNTGDHSLHIKEIRAEVLDAKTINCSQQGGGILVSAEYSVTVPYDPWQMKSTTAAVSTAVDFTVRPSSSDRMLITVGPSEEGNGSPIVLAVRLTLIPDRGDPIEIEPVAVVQPDSAESQIRALRSYSGTGVADDCVAKARTSLAGLIGVTKSQSPGVAYLRDELPRVV